MATPRSAVERRCHPSQLVISADRSENSSEDSRLKVGRYLWQQVTVPQAKWRTFMDGLTDALELALNFDELRVDFDRFGSG